MSVVHRFRITFHAPFRVSTGNAAPGVDDTANIKQPLPASSLKGLMRHSATEFFPNDVDAVFGGPGLSSPWAWDPPLFDTVPQQSVRSRISLVDGTAERGGLLVQQELWAESAQFDICQIEPLSASELNKCRIILESSARATHHLGADRRRGLGWVSIEPCNSLDINTLVHAITTGKYQ